MLYLFTAVRLEQAFLYQMQQAGHYTERCCKALNTL